MRDVAPVSECDRKRQLDLGMIISSLRIISAYATYERDTLDPAHPRVQHDVQARHGGGVECVADGHDVHPGEVLEHEHKHICLDVVNRGHRCGYECERVSGVRQGA
jgi:hypothetical protein